MARVENNVIVRGARGSFGDQVVMKGDKAGRTILGNKPVFGEDRVFTEAQRGQQERFRAARAYARETKHLAIYQARASGTPQTPSNIAMSDWFNPPEIREVDLSAWTGQAGEIIRIHAVDDVQVAAVRVMITDESRNVLEAGEAVLEGGNWWSYRTTAGGGSRVVVSAEDLPGHVVSASVQ